MTRSTHPSVSDPSPERSGTVLETDEDVRQALLAASRMKTSGVTAETRPTEPIRTASPFRPTVRPPVPILTVCDDGKADGEVIRIRVPRFTIGRAEGDLRFPLDGRMSGRHVEITHQVVGGKNRWVVTDLQSTHGMLVRVSKTALADKAEFLVGGGRYRFDAGRTERDETLDHAPGRPDSGETQGLADGPGSFRPPALTELLGAEIGNRVLLVKDEYWIGSDPSCQVCRSDDPFCEARHARVYRGSGGSWRIEHQKTQNGLWLRMAQIPVDSMIQFQVGEQRFKLQVV